MQPDFTKTKNKKEKVRATSVLVLDQPSNFTFAKTKICTWVLGKERRELGDSECVCVV